MNRSEIDEMMLNVKSVVGHDVTLPVKWKQETLDRNGNSLINYYINKNQNSNDSLIFQKLVIDVQI